LHYFIAYMNNRIIDITATAAIFLMTALPAFSATRFEELDKPPEGAHQGQIFIGAFATIGAPYGKILDAENNFIRNSTYTFTNNAITKKIMVLHLSYSYGILFEYMPVDHLGLKFKARRSNIVQRTMFGANYQNWTKLLYSDYTFMLGPSVHFTVRKQWDFSLTPVAGYSLGEYIATPIAARLIYTYAGARKKVVYNPIVGAEFNLSIYFSGGFFMSFGCDWSMNMMKFENKFYLVNPQTLMWFFTNRDSSYLHSVCFILSAGYAVSN
jgi:hypothetical protein